MKVSLSVLAVVALSLTACHKSPSDKLADQVQNAADSRADVLDNYSNTLDAQAKQERESGKRRSDAIDAANANLSTMTQQQRDAIVANDAAAVR